MGGGSADEIIMTSTSNPEVLAVCYAQGWCASPDFMLKSEAEAVTDIGTAFYQNTSITHFNEFVYFTGITSLPSSGFRNCSSLSSITLPPSLLRANGNYTFMSCTSLSFLEVPEGVLQVNGTQWIYGSHIERLIIPSTVTVCHRTFAVLNTNGRDYKCTVICKAVNPPTLNGTPDSPSVNAVYVPDESVDTYKSDTYWSMIADKIKPMSELQ